MTPRRATSSVTLPAAVVAVAAGLGAGACKARVPTPPICSHEGDTPVRVPYPPPAAEVELVGPAPDDGAIWIDGSWQWTGQGYAWTAGGWQPPAPGAAYAPPSWVRRDDGELVYFPPSWHGSAPDGGTGGARP